MSDFTRYLLEFNGEQFRVMQVDEVGDRQQVGLPSCELALTLRTASKALGDRMLVLKLEVGRR